MPVSYKPIRIIALTCVLLAVAAALFVIASLTRPVTPEAAVDVLVKPGTSLHRVANELEQRGVISDATLFRLFARFRGDTGRVKAGEYAFSEAASAVEVLDRLVAGDVRRYRLTIPEGFNLKETAARVEKAGIATADEFMALAHNAEFIAELELNSPSLEGYLYPETYTYTAASTLRELLRSMVAQYRSSMNDELLAAAGTLGLDEHQLVTLASIVQKEAGNNEEMPLIAAVFHNRLNKRIPLQADPTVIYGVEDFDGNLTRAHLRMPTPYNTYTMVGLPPGPIASPGMTALRATAFPAEADFLYFVARGDGTHEFSRTLREHNRAVRTYQLRR